MVVWSDMQYVTCMHHYYLQKPCNGKWHQAVAKLLQSCISNSFFRPLITIKAVNVGEAVKKHIPLIIFLFILAQRGKKIAAVSQCESNLSKIKTTWEKAELLAISTTPVDFHQIAPCCWGLGWISWLPFKPRGLRNTRLVLFTMYSPGTLNSSNRPSSPCDKSSTDTYIFIFWKVIETELSFSVSVAKNRKSAPVMCR